LGALLNSLQMGFKTLAIEKRSSELWQLLSAFKSEFFNSTTFWLKRRKNKRGGRDDRFCG
jgi:DNA recombination protein RmuC